jgi:hypothetical protein
VTTRRARFSDGAFLDGTSALRERAGGADLAVFFEEEVVFRAGDRLAAVLRAVAAVFRAAFFVARLAVFLAAFLAPA